MLGRRRRRWANIDQTLGQCLMFVGMTHKVGCLSPHGMVICELLQELSACVENLDYRIGGH